MLSATGTALIEPKSEVKEFQLQQNNSILLQLKLVAKDPYKSARHYYNCAVIVPFKFIEQARKKLVPGQFIQIRLGELKGRKTENGAIFNDVITKWQWIEVLNAVPNSERKEDI